MRANVDRERSRSLVRSQYQYQYQYQEPEQVNKPTIDAVVNKQPDEPDQEEQYEQDQSLPWQQQEALVQHIADREGVYLFCVCDQVPMLKCH